MIFELKTIALRRYLIISIGSFLVAFGVTIWLAVLKEPTYAMILLLASLPASIISALYFSTFTTELIIDNNQLVFKSNKVEYKDIDKYFLNEEGTNASALELRLYSGEVVTITYTALGSTGKRNKEIILELKSCIEKQNSESTETNYQGIHVKQAKYLRPIILVIIGVILILNLAVIYLVLFSDRDFPVQILIANISLIGIIPLAKRAKNNTSEK
ncbi:MAG: hypothetical protein QNK23_14430 [Crocinitomicaceae bacterium]|nr:hypothetical protein [Crocinitomicaceae bacterium]